MQVTYGKGFDFAPALSLSGKVQALEVELLKMPQADIVTEHTFKPGIYERKITIPAWTVLTGAAHKTDYHVRLEKGTIAVNTEDGIKTFTGPFEFAACAGLQRAGRVFDEEVVWVDVYANPDNCRDILKLEDRLYVVPEYGLGDSRTEEQKAAIAYRAFLYKLGMNDGEVNETFEVSMGVKKTPIDICALVASRIQAKCNLVL
jgi:hypothetical protein